MTRQRCKLCGCTDGKHTPTTAERYQMRRDVRRAFWRGATRPWRLLRVRHGRPGGWRRMTRVLLAIVIAAGAASVADAAAAPLCSAECVKRVNVRQAYERNSREWRRAPATVRGHLRRIALCESENNERAISPGGSFRGLLQFSPPTWASVGGRGDPAARSRMEQWARGVRLYMRSGPGQWPVCQHR